MNDTLFTIHENKWSRILGSFAKSSLRQTSPRKMLVFCFDLNSVFWLPFCPPIRFLKMTINIQGILKHLTIYVVCGPCVYFFWVNKSQFCHQCCQFFSDKVGLVSLLFSCCYNLLFLAWNQVLFHQVLVLVQLLGVCTCPEFIIFGIP